MHPGWATTEGVKKGIPGFYKFYEVRHAAEQLEILAEGILCVICNV